jgi:PQQ-like domain
VRTGRAVFVAVVAAALIGSPASRAYVESADTSWTSFGHDGQIDGFTAAKAFTPSVKGFSLVWKTQLDGGITASPLAAPVAGRGLVTFASTEKGNVYAVGPTGHVLWERSLGTETVNGGCGTYGIDSTAVLDLQRGVLYVVGSTGMLHALSLGDGTEAPGWPVQIVLRRRTEYVWGGLRLLGTNLYVPVASYCDAPDRRGAPAEGRLVLVNVTAPASSPGVFDPVPGPDNLGGIWGWGGVAINPAGTALFTGVGNAEPDVDDGSSDSMVELSTDLSEVFASARPTSAAPGEDTDIGAAPVLFQPSRCPALLAANSKSGELLVWRQDRMRLHADIPLSDGIYSFVGAPSWSPRTQMLYDSGVTEQQDGKRLQGTIALQVNPQCGFTARWFVATGNGSMPEPLVAGDLVASTGGFAGGFVVSRAATGTVVWRYSTPSATLGPMIEAGSRLIGGDEGGLLYSFKPH